MNIMATGIKITPKPGLKRYKRGEKRAGHLGNGPELESLELIAEGNVGNF
jgi:hypothetical protein